MSSSDFDIVGDDDSIFFRFLHQRSLNTLNTNYLLPVDQDEIQRSDFHHRMLQFVFSGKNYIGPVKQALQFGQQRRILDLGTGGGAWAIDMADEFPRAEVIGIDLAPIQPRTVPPNCTFELCDLDQAHIPYPDGYFDFVHARSMHIGIHDYPRFLREVARILRPGGLLLIIEPDLNPASVPLDIPPVPPPVAQAGPSSLPPASRASLPRLTIPSVASSSRSVPSTSTSERPTTSYYASPVSSQSSSETYSGVQRRTISSRRSTPTQRTTPIRTTPTRTTPTRTTPTRATPTRSTPIQRTTPTPTRTTPTPTQWPTPTPTHRPTPTQPPDLPGWTALWETYRACLARLGLDITVPQCLPELLAGVTCGEEGAAGRSESESDSDSVPGRASGKRRRRGDVDDDGLMDTGQPAFEKIVVQEGNIPVGFWPQDQNLLTIGQFQWMDYDLLVPAMRPTFLIAGLPPSHVDRLVENAQRDLYYPTVPSTTRLHIVYATRCY